MNHKRNDSNALTPRAYENLISSQGKVTGTVYNDLKYVKRAHTGIRRVKHPENIMYKNLEILTTEWDTYNNTEETNLNKINRKLNSTSNENISLLPFDNVNKNKYLIKPSTAKYQTNYPKLKKLTNINNDKQKEYVVSLKLPQSNISPEIAINPIRSVDITTNNIITKQNKRKNINNTINNISNKIILNAIIQNIKNNNSNLTSDYTQYDINNYDINYINDDCKEILSFNNIIEIQKEKKEKNKNKNKKIKKLLLNKYFRDIINRVSRKIKYINQKGETLYDEIVMNLLIQEANKINATVDNNLEAYCNIKNFSHIIKEKTKNGEESKELYLLPFINKIIRPFSSDKIRGKKFNDKNGNQCDDNTDIRVKSDSNIQNFIIKENVEFIEKRSSSFNKEGFIDLLTEGEDRNNGKTNEGENNDEKQVKKKVRFFVEDNNNQNNYIYKNELIDSKGKNRKKRIQSGKPQLRNVHHFQLESKNINKEKDKSDCKDIKQIGNVKKDDKLIQDKEKLTNDNEKKEKSLKFKDAIKEVNNNIPYDQPNAEKEENNKSEDELLLYVENSKKNNRAFSSKEENNKTKPHYNKQKIYDVDKTDKEGEYKDYKHSELNEDHIREIIRRKKLSKILTNNQQDINNSQLNNSLTPKSQTKQKNQRSTTRKESNFSIATESNENNYSKRSTKQKNTSQFGYQHQNNINQNKKVHFNEQEGEPHLTILAFKNSSHRLSLRNSITNKKNTKITNDNYRNSLKQDPKNKTNNDDFNSQVKIDESFFKKQKSPKKFQKRQSTTNHHPKLSQRKQNAKLIETLRKNKKVRRIEKSKPKRQNQIEKEFLIPEVNKYVKERMERIEKHSEVKKKTFKLVKEIKEESEEIKKMMSSEEESEDKKELQPQPKSEEKKITEMLTLNTDITPLCEAVKKLKNISIEDYIDEIKKECDMYAKDDANYHSIYATQERLNWFMFSLEKGINIKEKKREFQKKHFQLIDYDINSELSAIT